MCRSSGEQKDKRWGRWSSVHSKVTSVNLCNRNAQTRVAHRNPGSRSNHLTSATIHRPEILVKLLSNGKVHVEVSKGGDGADLHGTRVGIVGDKLVGLQQAHDLPHGNVDV